MARSSVLSRKHLFLVCLFLFIIYLSLSNFIYSGSARLTGKISYLKYDPPVRVLPLHERLAGMRAEILNGSGRTTAYEFMGVTSPNLVELFVKELSIVYSYANGSAADYMAMRLSACKKSMPSSICNNKWRLERSRDSGEILYSLRSIAKYMPWFKGHIYIVTPTGKGPEYFNYSNPKLHIIHQKDIMSQDTIPSFANDCQEYFLTNVKGLKDRFIIFDDDTFVGRLAPPSIFLTQFGGNNLFVEDSLVDDCPCDAHNVWSCSVCNTLRVLRHVYGDGSVPFHYMKHAPRVYSRQVIEYIHSVKEFDFAIRRGCRNPFRSKWLIQFDFLHHHVLMQTHKHDFGVSTGWNNDMHLIQLAGKDLSAWKKLVSEWSERPPLFFAINDEGWSDCRFGDVFLNLMNTLYPNPSEFELPDAPKMIKFKHCKYP